MEKKEVKAKATRKTKKDLILSIIDKKFRDKQGMLKIQKSEFDKGLAKIDKVLTEMFALIDNQRKTTRIVDKIDSKEDIELAIEQLKAKLENLK